MQTDVKGDVKEKNIKTASRLLEMKLKLNQTDSSNFIAAVITLHSASSLLHFAKITNLCVIKMIPAAEASQSRSEHLF